MKTSMAHVVEVIKPGLHLSDFDHVSSYREEEKADGIMSVFLNIDSEHAPRSIRRCLTGAVAPIGSAVGRYSLVGVLLGGVFRPSRNELLRYWDSGSRAFAKVRGSGHRKQLACDLPDVSIHGGREASVLSAEPIFQVING